MTKVGRVRSLLWLFLLFPVLLSANEDGWWEKSLSQLEQQKDKGALQTLLANQKSPQASSPEFYDNVSTAYWRLGQKGESVSSLGMALVFERSPFRNLPRLGHIVSLEKSSGVREPLSQNWQFWLPRVLTANGLVLLLVLAGWSLLFVGLSFFYPFRPLKPFRPAFGVGAMLLLSLSLFGRYLGEEKYAVVVGQDPISLYESETAQEELVKLPAGSVLKVGEQTKNRLQVHQPLVGWVSLTATRPIPAL